MTAEWPGLALGLHVDLGEWAFVDGEWVRRYSFLPGEAHAESQLREEVRRQLDAFRRIVGRDPTHLDSHQHVHREQPLRSVCLGLAEELGVPLRHFAPRVRHVGGFYGQAADGSPYPEGSPSRT